jgi:hypothetical protein
MMLEYGQAPYHSLKRFGAVVHTAAAEGVNLF